MGLYNIDEAVFELPSASADGAVSGAWEDQTVNILGTPAPDGSNFGLVVARLKGEAGQPLHALAEKYLGEHERKLRGFELLGRRESVIGGLPAVEAKLTWLNDGKAIFNHVAFIMFYGTVLIFTGSSLAKHAERCEQMMGELFLTLRFRER
jgi:hypothetical protein